MTSAFAQTYPLWQACLALLALGALGSGALTRAVIEFALRKRIVARRDLRRRHDRETPLLGGTAIFGVVMTVTALAWAFPSLLPGTPPSGRFFLCFSVALTMIFAVGVVDDLVELKAAPKFAAQFAAAGLMLLAQPSLPPVFNGIPVPAWAMAAILVVWIVGVTNATNMIDGLDGLCAGVSGLSALSLGVILLSTGGNGEAFPALLAFAMAGACVGFLVFNFFPARVFLGDSGSLTLGFLLATLSLQVPVKRHLFLSLTVPIFSLGLPLLDAALAMLRRRMMERSIFQGDRGHIHHRLRNIGLSHRNTVLLLWFATGYFNLQAFLLAQVPVGQSYYIFASVVLTSGFWLTGLYYVERRLSLQAARFSQLFLKQEEMVSSDREALSGYVRDQIAVFRETQAAFSMVVVDSAELLRQLASERPARMVQFHVGLYGILKDRLRDTDLVCRVSDYRVIAVLPAAGEHNASGVIKALAGRVRELQESFQVYQSHHEFPEGFKVLYYPRDAERIAVVVDSVLNAGTARRAVQAAASAVLSTRRSS